MKQTLSYIIQESNTGNVEAIELMEYFSSFDFIEKETYIKLTEKLN